MFLLLLLLCTVRAQDLALPPGWPAPPSLDFFDLPARHLPTYRTQRPSLCASLSPGCSIQRAGTNACFESLGAAWADFTAAAQATGTSASVNFLIRGEVVLQETVLLDVAGALRKTGDASSRPPESALTIGLIGCGDWKEVLGTLATLRCSPDSFTTNHNAGFGEALGIHVIGGGVGTGSLVVVGLRLADCAPALAATELGRVEMDAVAVLGNDGYRPPAPISVGGVLLGNVTSAVIWNSEFARNGGWDGALSYVGGGDIEISNTTFDTNRAYGEGGAVTIREHGQEVASHRALVAGCTFRNNTAWAGGAVITTAWTLVRDSTFSANNADAMALQGTALQTSSRDRLFRTGGAVAALSPLWVVGSQFSDNFAFQGGALAASAQCVVMHSRFDGNVGGRLSKENVQGWLWYERAQGGAIVAGSGIHVAHSAFAHNQAATGGAIQSDANVLAINCSFAGNAGTGKGGAIQAEGGALIHQCRFVNNSIAKGMGGAVYSFGCSVTNASFVNNTAARGGALCLGPGSDAAISASFFQLNSATDGGAVYVDGPLVVANGSHFANNTADEEGGAIFVDTGGAVDASGTLFEGNNAMANASNSGGGAIAAARTSNTTGPVIFNMGALFSGPRTVGSQQVAVRGCKFVENSAVNAQGGAVLMQAPTGPAGGQFLAHACVFEHNMAGLASSAVHAPGTTTTILDSQFFANTVHTGSATVTAGLLAIVNSTFRGNFAVLAPAVIEVQQAPQIAHSEFTCNFALDGASAVMLVRAQEGQKVAHVNTTYRDNACPTGCAEASYWTGECEVLGHAQDLCACLAVWNSGEGQICSPATMSCRTNASVPYGLDCACKDPGSFKNGNFECQKCATCGQGKVVRDCGPQSNTVCECPVGMTGDGCLQPCSAPFECARVDATKPCNFSADGYRVGPCAECNAGYFLQPDGTCTQCSSHCGHQRGKVLQNCTGTSDVLCQCPVGFTGLECAEPCKSPPQCKAALPGCGYDRQDFSLGVRCIECAEDHWLSAEGQTQRLSMTSTDTFQMEFLLTPYGTCMRVQTCAQGHVALTEATATSDRVCGPPPGRLSTGEIAGIVIGCLVAVALCLSGVFICAKRRGQQHTEKKYKQIIADIKRSHDWVDHDTAEASRALEQLGQEEGVIARQRFVLLEGLGQGEFGVVHKGVVFVQAKAVECAIKSARLQTLQAQSDFVREAAIMKRLQHPHIVRIYGVSCEAGPHGDARQYLVLEYMDMGDLRSVLLRDGPGFSLRLRLILCLQIAQAVDYLGSLTPPIVHRDIAARNVLLSRGSGLAGQAVCKLSDLGLAQQLEVGASHTVYRDTAKVPGRWWAPECLQRFVFSCKTDLWAAAVTFWEIFSNGATPYELLFNPLPGRSFMDTMLEGLRCGVRLPCPEACPPSVYEAMRQCWEWEASQRPNSSQLVLRITEELERAGQCTPREALGQRMASAYDMSKPPPEGMHHSLEVPSAARLKDPQSLEAFDNGYVAMWSGELTPDQRTEAVAMSISQVRVGDGAEDPNLPGQ